jgi:ATP-dependent Clp protease ATP-binding subunit ClpA
MFERFTDEARHVVVQAQLAAQDLRHSYIGTEHLLLGLAGDGLVTQGIIERFGSSRAELEDRLLAEVGPGKKAPSGHIPFTANAKAVLKSGLSNAQRVGDRDILPEDLLLAIVEMPGSVAYRILALDEGSVGVLIAELTARSSTEVQADQPGHLIGDLSTGTIEMANDAAGANPAHPRCAFCHGALEEYLTHRTLTSNSANHESADVVVAYCGRCGTAVGIIGPA